MRSNSTVNRLVSFGLTLSLTTGLLLIANDAQAQPSNEKGVVRNDANTKGTKHYWYDGDQRKELTIDTGSVARFALGEKAIVIDRKLSVTTSQPAEKAIGINESPMFIDGGLKRGLPGGVVVTLLRSMPDDQAVALLKSAGLEPVRALMDSRIWLVASAPGMASLELANKIHEGKQFAASQPHWWTPKAKK